MQMKLSPQELTRIGIRVEQCYRSALSDHQERMRRFRTYYRSFRNIADPVAAGEEEASNYQVPLLQWQVFSKWADLMHAWLGKGSETVAEPTGPYDQKIVDRISRMMTWRVFTYMKITKAAAIATFRAVLFGRSHVYMPWDQEVDRDGRIWYDGPKYIPLWPDDFIVPAEDVLSLHEFSWVMHKERLTPQQLLDGERGEKYVGITKDFANIIQAANQNRNRNYADDELKDDKDEAEGVTHENSVGSSKTLTVLHWYGRRRMPKGKKDVDDDAVDGRELDESEIVAHYCLELNRCIGAQSMQDLYPKSRHKRPFGEIALNEEGSYWTMGYGEMLKEIAAELTSNHNLFTDAGEMSVFPVIFAAPEAGLSAKSFRYEPKTLVTTEHPEKVNAVRVQADMSYSITKEHTMLAIGERVTGQSEQSMGRSSDRPNAPRTASGQVLLAEFGNLRGSLDAMFFREHLEAHLKHLWTLEQQFAPKDLFFRVTEEDMPGTAVQHGFGQMKSDDYENEFDFTLKFAPSPWAKEAMGQKNLQLYQLDLANPLIVQNPKALWAVTNKMHKALGDDNFADTVPAPADMGNPIDPKTEWTMILQGDLPDVNPMDNDDLHLADHGRRLQMAGEDVAPDGKAAMEAHMQKHIVQRGQKALMHQMVQQMAGSLAGLVQPGQQAGGAPPMGAAPIQPPAAPEPGPQGIRGRVQNAIEGM
jgi:hypothetical protein